MTALEIGFAAQKAPHFGGSKDYAARGRELKALGVPVLGLTETLVLSKNESPDAMRNSIRTVLGKTWKVHVHSGGSVCLMWDSRRMKYGALTSRLFVKSDPWHGAMRVPLYDRVNKVWIDVIVMHNRPGSVASPAQKEAYLKAALGLVRPGKRTVVLGDFAMNADKVMAAHGFVRATPKVDSYDTAGVQYIDAGYALKGQKTKPGRSVEMRTSDHDAQVMVLDFA